MNFLNFVKSLNCSSQKTLLDCLAAWHRMNRYQVCGPLYRVTNFVWWSRSCRAMIQILRNDPAQWSRFRAMIPRNDLDHAAWWSKLNMWIPIHHTGPLNACWLVENTFGGRSISDSSSPLEQLVTPSHTVLKSLSVTTIPGPSGLPPQSSLPAAADC